MKKYGKENREKMILMNRKIKEILDNHERRISRLEGILKEKTARKIVSKKKSILDLLIELKNEGFFKQPKYLKDIVDKLASRGYHYQSSSLTNPLQRAVRNRILGRIKKKGKWAYVER